MRYSLVLLLIAGMTIVSSTAYSADNTVHFPAHNQMMGWGWGQGWSGEISPGVAALLSLQPMPVDLGNFYVDDWKKGILYTTLELGIFVPGVMLMSGHNMGHSHSKDNESWTDSERVTFYSLLTGYIAVKIISAFDAASTAEDISRGGRLSLGFEPYSQMGSIAAHISF